MEDQAEYITESEEALQMLGKGYNTDPIPPSEFISTLSGFTLAPDVLINEYGYVTALTWGVVWRFCQMSDGVCRASLGKIAKRLGMSERTIIRHIADLCIGGYLKDTTPDLRNKPHIYADTGKIRVRLNLSAMTESHSAMTESHRQGDRESLEESIKKESKKQKKVYKPSTAKPDFRNLQPNQYRSIPELKTFMDATGWIPGSFVLETVYDFVIAGLTFDQIKGAFTEWTARGYKPANVQGYLTWARDGIPPAYSKESKVKKSESTTQATPFMESLYATD